MKSVNDAEREQANPPIPVHHLQESQRNPSCSSNNVLLALPRADRYPEHALRVPRESKRSRVRDTLHHMMAVRREMRRLLREMICSAPGQHSALRASTRVQPMTMKRKKGKGR